MGAAMIRAVATDEDRRTAAADWVVRLQAPDLAEADALAFDVWLQESPENGAAYDEALAVWREFGTHAQAVRQDLSGRRPPPRHLWIGLGAAAAAAAAIAVVLPSLRPAPQPSAYATAAGEHRTVTLADGTRIDLNGATRLSVVLRRHERDVRMDGGEAIFDVAADKSRPFLIAAGDRTVRVVGTQFDVRRRDGRLAVTVTRGTVEVGPGAGSAGEAVRLTPGQRFEHVEGAAIATVTAAAPDEALGWRSGRLVYRGQPLGDVVADLNAQFRTPIRVADAGLAATPISGVLILDKEDAVVRRLALLVSARAVVSDAGVTLQPVETPQH
jgi:transmembrane sensor